MKILADLRPSTDQGTENWIDITSAVKLNAITRNQAYHNKLKATTNNLKMELIGTATDWAKRFLTATYEIPIKVYEDDPSVALGSEVLPYFSGYVKTKFSGVSKSRFKGLPIEAVDYNWKLNKKIESSGVWTGKKVCDPADTSNSLIHLLMGLVVADPTTIVGTGVTVSDVIPFFGFDKEEKFSDVLSTLLYEVGHTYYFDPSGMLTIGAVLPGETLPVDRTVLTNEDMKDSLTVTRKEEEKKGAIVETYDVHTDEGALIFSDTTGGDSFNKANIEVAAGEYYPLESSDTVGTICNYSYKGEILGVANASLELSSSPGVTPAYLDLTGLKSAEIAIPGATTITKLDITGDVTYRTSKRIVTETLSEPKSDDYAEYSAKYISETTQAEYLADIIAIYYRFSDYSYAFKSTLKLELGEVVKIEENVTLGYSTDAQVVRIIDKGKGLYTYVLEGVSEWDPSQEIGDSTTQGENVQPDPITIVIPDFDDVPSWDDIADQNIPEDTDGYTLVPTDIQLLVATTGYRSVTLRWDVQGSGGGDRLSNLDGYEIQVSKDLTNWYALGAGVPSDPDSWKDEDVVDGYTTVQGELYVHAGLPLDTDGAGEPVGTSYSYRVRRLTKADLRSDWTALTANVSGVASPIESGDIAAGAVTANHVETALLNATRAEIGTDGSRTTAIEGAMIQMADESDPEAPFLRMGGKTENGDFLPYMTGMGVMNPGANLPDSDTAIPTVNCGIASFDALDFVDHTSKDRHVSVPSAVEDYVSGKFTKGFRGETFIRGDMGFASPRSEGGISAFIDAGTDTTLKMLESVPRFFEPVQLSENATWTNATSFDIRNLLVREVNFVSENSTEWIFNVVVQAIRGTNNLAWAKYEYNISVAKDTSGLIAYDEQWIRDQRTSDAEGISVEVVAENTAVTETVVDTTNTSDYTVFIGIDMVSGSDPETTLYEYSSSSASLTFDPLDHDEVIRLNMTYVSMSFTMKIGQVERWLQIENRGEFDTSGGTVVINGTDSLLAEDGFDFFKVYSDGSSVDWEFFLAGVSVHTESNTSVLRESITDPSFTEIGSVDESKRGVFGAYINTDGYIDDLLIYDETSAEIEAEIDDHAGDSEAWNPIYNDGDIILAPKTGGTVRILGELDADNIVTVVGPTGPQGTQGETGVQGETGGTGEQGIQGEVGDNYWNGSSRIISTSDPDDAQGSDGDFWFLVEA